MRAAASRVRLRPTNFAAQAFATKPKRNKKESAKLRKQMAELRNARAANAAADSVDKVSQETHRLLVLAKNEPRPKDMTEEELSKRKAFFEEHSLFMQRLHNDVNSRLSEVRKLQLCAYDAIPIQSLKSTRTTHPYTFPRHRIADARYWTPPQTTSAFSVDRTPKRLVERIIQAQEKKWADKEHSLKGVFSRVNPSE